MENNATNVATIEHEKMQNYQEMVLNKMFAQKLQQNEEQTKTWTDNKKKYQKVIEGLQIFPLSVSKSCMVPIGKRAFMKGKLIHTNEIMAYLGEDYFVKYSASQAIELCNRKIKYADEMLKSLEAERNLFEAREIFLSEHSFNEKDAKNIQEHWTEDELGEWRTHHRQREKEYHQKLTNLKKKENADDNVEDLFKRLDELELEEELEDMRLKDERERFYDNDLEEGEVYDESEEDDDLSDCDDEITIEAIQEEIKKLKAMQIDKTTNGLESKCDMSSSNITQNQISNIDVSESKCDDVLSSNVTQNQILNIDVIENKQFDLVHSNQEELKYCPPEPKDIASDGCNTDIKKKARVSFVEPCVINHYDVEDERLTFESSSTIEDICDNENYVDDDNDTIRIEFSHSSHIPITPESSVTEVQSPVDVYKMFIPFDSNVLKSILKRSPNDIPNEAIVPLNEDTTDPEDEDELIYPCIKSFEINDVQERKVTAFASEITMEKRDEKRPMSKFKMRRAILQRNSTKLISK